LQSKPNAAEKGAPARPQMQKVNIGLRMTPSVSDVYWLHAGSRFKRQNPHTICSRLVTSDRTPNMSVATGGAMRGLHGKNTRLQTIVVFYEVILKSNARLFS